MKVYRFYPNYYCRADRTSNPSLHRALREFSWGKLVEHSDDLLAASHYVFLYNRVSHFPLKQMNRTLTSSFPSIPFVSYFSPLLAYS